MSEVDYYKVLGVSPEASQEEIKKVYRNLARENHPDHGGDETKFKEISEAYNTISDPDKRREYDFMRAGGGGAGFGNMRDFADMFGFGGSSPFGFRHQRPDPNRPIRGRDIKYAIEVPLKYFIFGGKLDFDLSYKEICNFCRGTGAEEARTCSTCGGTGQISRKTSDRGMYMVQTVPCVACAGRGSITTKACSKCENGSIRVDKTVNLDLPKNISDGHVVAKEGEGMSGLNGGPSGDLFVRLGIKLPREEELTDKQKKVLQSL